MSDYLYDSPDDCVAAGHHLESCDNDGYCNYCGHQEYGDDPEFFDVNDTNQVNRP